MNLIAFRATLRLVIRKEMSKWPTGRFSGSSWHEDEITFVLALRKYRAHELISLYDLKKKKEKKRRKKISIAAVCLLNGL